MAVNLAAADPAGDIAAKQSQAGQVKTEIDSMNQQLEAKVESYNAANLELGRIEGSIKQKEQELAAAKAKLSQEQATLNDRVSRIYRDGSASMLDVLMDTSSLNDFLSTYDMLSKLSEQDRNNVDQIKILKAQVEQEQTKLENDKSSQENLVSQLASDKSQIQSGISDRQQKLASINTDIQTLQKQEQQQEAAAAAAQAAAQRQTASASYDSNSGSPAPAASGPAPAPRAGGVVGIAMQYLGVPYVWGGASPSGFDCSGLVMYVYAQVGISLPHSAAAQYEAGTPISQSQLAPGDLVFFGDGGIEHVGIYIGGGSMIHAPYPGTVVQISPLSGGGSYRGACRL